MKKHYLIQFRNTHKDKACLICARGPSMQELKHDPRLKEFTTIGINCLEHDGFTPTHAVTMDKHDNFKDPLIQGYRKTFLNTQSEYFFTYADIPSKKQIRFDFRGIGVDGHREIQDCHDNDFLFYSRTSTIVGISLAIYMGFKWIGILGFDCTDHLMKYEVGNLEIACEQIWKHCTDKGLWIHNLSEQSLIKAFPLKPFSDFYHSYRMLT